MTALKLLTCLSEIESAFIEEAHQSNLTLFTISHKKVAKYGAIAALSLAATYWLVKGRQRAA